MKGRRGLSTVVGAAFAIIAITSTVAYVSYSTNILNQYNNAVIVKNQALSDSNKESFKVTSVAVIGNKLNITVVNSGILPINLTKIWIRNTTATDWVHSYSPANSFASPSATLTNVGQNIPVFINQANSYNIKLVTSRGNTQIINMNSANAQPLNMQLFASPPSVDVGFQSQIVMVVTNNSTGILTNITPGALTQTSGLATCTISQVSPASINTLLPGSSAIFTWPIKIISANNGQTCVFTISPALQNGYSQSLSTTMTATLVTFAQTNFAQNSGLLTLNYSSFRWAATGQGGTWNTGFSFPHSATTAFKLNMTNNNATGTFYISQKTTLLYFSTHISPSQQPTPFYIVNFTNPTTMSSTTYNNCNGQSDYCLSIPPGSTVTLYLAAQTRGTNTAQSFGAADINSAFFLIFGKYSTSQTASAREYAQNIPYIAADVT